MKTLFKQSMAATVFLLAMSAAAQQKAGLTHKPVLQPDGDKAPVSRAEFRVVALKLRGLLHTVLAVDTSKIEPVPTGGSEPVARGQIVDEFARLMKLAEPTFKTTPHTVKFNPDVLRLSDAKTKARAETLIAWGFVARVGPLVAGDSVGLTPIQLGDSIGFFLARLSDVTHMPSIKWSPYLQKN